MHLGKFEGEKSNKQTNKILDTLCLGEFEHPNSACTIFDISRCMRSISVPHQNSLLENWVAGSRYILSLASTSKVQENKSLLCVFRVKDQPVNQLHCIIYLSNKDQFLNKKNVTLQDSWQFFPVSSHVYSGFLYAFILLREIRVFQETKVHRVKEGGLAHQEKRAPWGLLDHQETEAIQDHQVIKVLQVHQAPQVSW